MTETSTMLTNLLPKNTHSFSTRCNCKADLSQISAKKTTKKCPSDQRHTFALPKTDSNFNEAHEYAPTNALSFSTRRNYKANLSQISAKKNNQKVSLGSEAHFCGFKNVTGNSQMHTEMHH